jgi:phosphonopyruvate decarboxylase
VNKDTFSKIALKPKEHKINEKSGRGLPHYSGLHPEPKSRYETIQTIMQDNENTVFIGTTGMTGREMYDINDNEHNLYMVGSMGCAAAIGLGIALNTDKRVIVIDGDGAAIMRLSVVPLVAEYAPKNLLHILLNNEVHDTTGGQATLSRNINWKDLMHSLGYNHSKSVLDLNELSAAIAYTKINPRLQFIEVKTIPGNKEGLGRPEVTPVQVKERLMNYLKS